MCVCVELLRRAKGERADKKKYYFFFTTPGARTFERERDRSFRTIDYTVKFTLYIGLSFSGFIVFGNIAKVRQFFHRTDILRLGKCCTFDEKFS